MEQTSLEGPSPRRNSLSSGKHADSLEILQYRLKCIPFKGQETRFTVKLSFNCSNYRQGIFTNCLGLGEVRVVHSVYFLEGRLCFPAIKTHSVPNLLARSTASGDQPIKTEKSNSAGARINREPRNKR